MAISAGNIGSRLIARLIIGFSVCAITLTVLGMIDVGKDAFGSHKNFADMRASEFREGDIVYGYISENLGCAATSESSDYSRYSSSGSHINGYYYVIPFYAAPDDPLPDKLILYKTGNRQQYTALDEMFTDTVDNYLNNGAAPSSLFVDRAEVTSMSPQEREAFRDYVENFVDALYGREVSGTIAYVKKAYTDAMVPYVVQYKADGGHTVLTVGLVMIGILIVGVLVFIAKTRSANRLDDIYVGAKDPNLNAPTGLENSNYNYVETTPVKPPVSSTQGPRLPRQPGSFRTDYSYSERPLPPVEGLPQQPRSRLIGYDPHTGRPVYSVEHEPTPEPAAVNKTMDSIDLKNTDLVDLSNGGIDKDEPAAEAAPTPEARPMQSVDPKAAAIADYDSSVEWQFRNDNAAMPMNGNIPVINAENFEPAQNFSQPVTADVPPEPAFPKTSDDDFLVQPTDPSVRNDFSQFAGGTVMPAVDLRTETNVDTSNGGIEREADKEFPTADIRTDFPEPAAVQTAPVPEPEQKPEPEPDSYNIFKTGGSSSYNIFKDSGSMGFPVENKDFPTLDTSFPTTDKDDFNS